MEHATEAVYSAVDALLFVAVLTIIIVLYSRGIEVNNQVQNAISNNETTSQSLVNASYEGYTKSGEAVYDGVLTGKQVFTDILNSSTNNITVVNGGTITNFATKNISYSVGGVTKTKLLIQYVRKDNSSKLLDYVDQNATYIRQYNTDASGNISDITYKKK